MYCNSLRRKFVKAKILYIAICIEFCTKRSTHMEYIKKRKYCNRNIEKRHLSDVHSRYVMCKNVGSLPFGLEKSESPFW